MVQKEILALSELAFVGPLPPAYNARVPSQHCPPPIRDAVKLLKSIELPNVSTVIASTLLKQLPFNGLAGSDKYPTVTEVYNV